MKTLRVITVPMRVAVVPDDKTVQVEVVCPDCGNHNFPRFEGLIPLYGETDCVKCTKHLRFHETEILRNPEEVVVPSFARMLPVPAVA